MKEDMSPRFERQQKYLSGVPEKRSQKIETKNPKIIIIIDGISWTFLIVVFVVTEESL